MDGLHHVDLEAFLEELKAEFRLAAWNGPFAELALDDPRAIRALALAHGDGVLYALPHLIDDMHPEDAAEEIEGMAGVPEAARERALHLLATIGAPVVRVGFLRQGVLHTVSVVDDAASPACEGLGLQSMSLPDLDGMKGLVAGFMGR